MTGLEHLFLDHGQPASVKKRVARVGLVLALCAVLLLVSISAYTEARRLERWTPTRCRIIESSVASIGTGRGRARPYHVRVLYEYEVSGQRHTDGSLDQRDSGTADASEAYATAAAHPAGRDDQCFVNPANPGEAVLTREPSVYSGLFVLVVGAGTAVVFLLYCVPQLRGVRPGPPGSLRGARFWAAVMACVFGAMFAAWYAIPLVRHVQSLSWTATPCKIVSSNVINHEVHTEQAHLTLYQTDILYQYVVGGQTYYSNRYQFTEGESLFAFTRESTTRRYPPGLTAVCYVNPADPRDAVLTRSLSPGLFTALFPLGVTGVALVVLFGKRGFVERPFASKAFAYLFFGWLVALVGGTIWGQFAPP